MPSITKPQLVHFLLAGTVVALVLSPFFLSVGMFLMAGVSLTDWKVENEKTRFFVDRSAVDRLRHWRKHPALISYTGLFLVVLLSVWGMAEPDYWLDRLRIKLPFLLLPFLFIALPPMREKEVRGHLYFLLSFMFATTVLVLINYGLHFDEIQLSIKRGQSIPVPRNHIRYSLVVALAVLGGCYLTAVRHRVFQSVDRWLIPTLTGLLFVMLHILAVRTGLLALYAALFVLGLGYAISKRNYLVLGLTLAGVFLAPILAYNFLPSIRTKINYVRYDYWKSQRGEGGDYADAGRIASLEIGYQLWREQPMLGTGAGGLRQAVVTQFEERYADRAHPLMPHNQYLYVAASTGLLGLAIFLFSFFFPLFYRRHYRYPPLLGFYVMLALVFMIEHTIENSLGAGYAALFLLLFLSRLQNEK